MAAKTTAKKPKASITWMINERGGSLTSDVIIDASGHEILIGLKTLVIEASKVIAENCNVPVDMAQQAILDSINKGESNE